MEAITISLMPLSKSVVVKMDTEHNAVLANGHFMSCSVVSGDSLNGDSYYYIYMFLYIVDSCYLYRLHDKHNKTECAHAEDSDQPMIVHSTHLGA